MVDELSLGLLGREVLGHAEDGVGHRARRDEVDELDLVARHQQHVLGGQVVMDDADLLSLQQGLANLGGDLLGAIEREGARGRHDAIERLPVHQLGHDEQGPVGLLAEVEQPGEPRALRALELLQLALRPLEHGRRRDRRAGHALVRHGRAGLRVAGPEDLAASGATQLSLELIAGRLCLRDHLETPRPLGGGAGLLRTEISVVGILGLTVRADFHPSPGVVTGCTTASPMRRTTSDGS